MPLIPALPLLVLPNPTWATLELYHEPLMAAAAALMLGYDLPCHTRFCWRLNATRSNFNATGCCNQMNHPEKGIRGYLMAP